MLDNVQNSLNHSLELFGHKLISCGFLKKVKKLNKFLRLDLPAPEASGRLLPLSRLDLDSESPSLSSA
jgi:hypothetical protein